MNTVINVDVRGSKGKFDVWLSNDGSSGCHYVDVGAEQIGLLTADYVDCLDEHETGESHLKSKDERCYIVGTQQCPVFIDEIIEIFEDFLDDRAVVLDNPEKHYDGIDPETTANIFGSDYGSLRACIEDTLVNWGIACREVSE